MNDFLIAYRILTKMNPISIPRVRILHYRGEFLDVLRYLFARKNYIDIFNNKFANYIGVKYALTVSSGRTALEVIIKAFEIKNGDEVILPAYTFYAVPYKLLEIGIKPVFVDIKLTDCNIDTKLIEEKVTKRTKAIIATHLFGHPCDMRSIIKIARRHNLIIIEDACQAHGCLYKGKKVGSIGGAAFFSLDTTKPINTFGGGVIVTNRRRIYEAAKREISLLNEQSLLSIIKKVIRSYYEWFLTNPLIFRLLLWPLLLATQKYNIDITKKYKSSKNKEVSKNLKFSNIQALIGIKQLSMLDSRLMQNRKNAQYMNRILPQDSILHPNKEGESIFYSYIIKSRNKEGLSRRLLQQRIDSDIEVMQDCEHLIAGKSQPNTSFIKRHAVKIPLYYQLTKKEIEYIAKVVNEFER